MKKYTHLVFDIDGTILDTLEIHMSSLQTVIEQYLKKTMTREELAFSFGLSGKATMGRLGFTNVEESFEWWLDEYVATAKRLGIEPYAGIREVLEELSEKKTALGVITSRARVEYINDFESKGWGTYFPCSITSSDTERGKPWPDPMLEYLKQTGARPEEVLYFGDTAYDMECARKAGVDCALVLWGCLLPEGIEATYRLEKPEEILKFV